MKYDINLTVYQYLLFNGMSKEQQKEYEARISTFSSVKIGGRL